MNQQQQNNTAVEQAATEELIFMLLAESSSWILLRLKHIVQLTWRYPNGCNISPQGNNKINLL